MSIRDDHELISLTSKPQKDDDNCENDSVVARESAFQSAHRKSPALENLEKGEEEFGTEDAEGNLSLKRESLYNTSLKNSPKQ